MSTLQKQCKTKEQPGEKKSKAPIKIGLLSNSGCGNLGETATQHAMIQSIRHYYPNADIHSFAPNPEVAQRDLDIPSFPTISCSGTRWWEGSEERTFTTKLIHILKKLSDLPSSTLRKPPIGVLELIAWTRAYNYLKQFDVLIVSGGGQLDDYCFGGRWGYPLTLLMWGLLAKLCDVKYYIVSVGAGPLDSQKSRFFVRVALSLVQYRSYRDEDSKQYVREIIGFSENDPVYPDLAHSLQLEKYQEAVSHQKSQKREDYRLVVGINTYMGLIMSGSITRLTPPYPCIGKGSLYVDYLNKLVYFISWLLQNQYKIVFIATETYGEMHDCRQIVRDIKSILEAKGVIYSEAQIVEDYALTLDDLMIQLSAMDVVVASRFHCVLLSQLMNKPVLALSFNSKIDSLMADTDQAGYCLQIDQFDVDTLRERFSALEANRDIIKQQLAKRTHEYREALKEQYENLFSSFHCQKS